MISVGAEMMFEDVFGDESIIGVKTFGVKSMSEKEKITNLYFFHVQHIFGVAESDDIQIQYPKDVGVE